MDDFGIKNNYEIVTLGEELQLPPCKECGCQAGVFKYHKAKGMHVITPITVKSDKASYVFACLIGCQNMIGPSPTISLLADIWRMKHG